MNVEATEIKAPRYEVVLELSEQELQFLWDVLVQAQGQAVFQSRTREKFAMDLERLLRKELRA